MEELRDLEQEREYTRQVQALLLSIVEQSTQISNSHSESIRAVVADAWDELRVRPTALSPQDLEQLSIEVDRFFLRKSFTDNLAVRYKRMLMNPFFARVDFQENGEEKEKIVIGLYSLKNEQGELLVHDWRAPVSSLYYDAMPGEVSYMSPSGEIFGRMDLKRQYRMEDGKLKYYVDTSMSIDDGMLLDILSGATSRHMRQIVSTIQQEQNAAIRYENAKVVIVVGSAGSGKTSVAMHRAAFLMYRQRDTMQANRIQILSPSSVFSEYISDVLPELGEENIPSRTLQEMVEAVLDHKVESPVSQLGRLLDAGGELRRKSVSYKCGMEFLRVLRRVAGKLAHDGPDFKDVLLDDTVLIRKDELTRMYRGELSMLTPAQRLMRMSQTLESRISSWEEGMYAQYERQFAKSYSGKELAFVCKMAVAQRLQPVRSQLRGMLDAKPAQLFEKALENAPQELKDAYRENREAGITWWEDAVAEAYLMVRMGFAQPDKSIYHLLVDEAQDYSETALEFMHYYLPRAHVTLLGDPMQRTSPAMPACDPANWGECFSAPEAKIFRLTKCYRASLPNARLCQALLPGEDALEPFGREGEAPVISAYSDDALKAALAKYRKDGHASIAVITRTQAEADALCEKLDGVYRLDGGDADLTYEKNDTVVGCYHLMKGLEFDAVIVAWPDVEISGSERRRLYTACSRALHAITFLGKGRLIDKLELNHDA